MVSDSTATVVSNTKAENIHLILNKIVTHLQQQQHHHQAQNGTGATTPPPTHPTETTTTARTFLADLENQCPPSVLLSILIPRLFSPSSSSNTNSTTTAPLSSHDTLTILTFLVTHNPTRFIIPISQSVRSEAERRLRLSSSPTSDDDTEVSDSALDAIVGQLQSPLGEVATNATQALLALCNGAMGVAASITGKRIISALTSSWKTIHSSSSEDTTTNHHLSTVTVRYGSLLVSILTSSGTVVADDDDEDLMQVAIQQSSLDLLLLDVVSSDDDPLLQMSILDQIERFATTGVAKMGVLRREWLTSSKVVNLLLRLAGGDDDDDDDGQVGGADGSSMDEDMAMDRAMPHPILGGSALRILSSICKLISNHFPIATPSSSSSSSSSECMLLTGFHRALRTFARNANGEVDRIALVDAISSFASVSEYALTSVLEEEEKRMGCGEEEGVVLRERWLDVGSMPQSKLKALVLCSIARVMDPSSLEEANSHGNGDGRQQHYIPSSKMSLQLFQYFGHVNTNGNTSPEQLLLNFSKSPFVEVRLGAYELMRAFVSKVKTGATILLSQEGFLEFLLSGEGEPVKEGKEARFAIVQAVLKSGTRQLLAENIVKDLERVVSDGPYYVKSVNWQLATEQ